MDSDDLTVLALTPAQMRPAQEGLIAWAQEKLRALNAEADEQDRAMEDAARFPFSNQRAQWARELNKTTKTIAYYDKIRQALEAGYIIVPDFPVDVFAVRTKTETPTGSYTASYPRREGTAFTQQAKALPPGEGRYVSDDVRGEGEEVKTKDAQGREVTKYRYTASEFRDVAIPARLVRPEILDATHRALLLKVFDEVGLVGQPRQDPIIVGKIIDPRDKYKQRRVSFFIAWWLDTATL